MNSKTSGPEARRLNVRLLDGFVQLKMLVGLNEPGVASPVVAGWVQTVTASLILRVTGSGAIRAEPS